MSAPLPPTGAFATASSQPQGTLRLFLASVWSESLTRISSSEFYGESTSSGVFWYTGSSPSSSYYYLYITGSVFAHIQTKYPYTTSVETHTGSFDVCTGSFGPPTSSVSGAFTGAYCLPTGSGF